MSNDNDSNDTKPDLDDIGMHETYGSGNDADCNTGVYDRWPYTNDLIASVVLVSVPALALAHGFGYLDLGELPSEFLLGYLALVGIAASWTFGRSAVNAWRAFNGNEGGSR